MLVAPTTARGLGFNAPPSPEMDGRPGSKRFATESIAGLPMRPLALNAYTTADITDDLEAQFSNMLEAFASRRTRKYRAGVLLKLEASTDGRPVELEFEECFVQLRGHVLTMNHRVTPPSHLNLSDARVKVDHDYTEITVGANGQRIVFRSVDPEAEPLDIRRWYTAIHHALFERARLQELYTAWLVNKFRTSDMFDHPPGEEKWRGTVEVRIASDALSIREYEQVFCIVRQATVGGQKKGLFGRKSKTVTPSTPAEIALYKSRKDLKEPFAVIYAFAAYAVYPDKPEFVIKSGLVKVEGTVAVKSTGTSSDGHVFMMMPPEPSERQSMGMLRGAKPPHTIVKFLNSIWLSFQLHGRPENLLVDVEHPEALGGVLLSLDIDETIAEGIDDLHSVRDWRRTLRERVVHKGYYSRASMMAKPVAKGSLASEVTLVQDPAPQHSASAYFARQAAAARRATEGASASATPQVPPKLRTLSTTAEVEEAPAQSIRRLISSSRPSTSGSLHSDKRLSSTGNDSESVSAGGYASSLLSHGAPSNVTARTDYDNESVSKARRASTLRQDAVAGSISSSSTGASTTVGRTARDLSGRSEVVVDEAVLEAAAEAGDKSPFVAQEGFAPEDALAMVQPSEEAISRVDSLRARSNTTTSSTSHESARLRRIAAEQEAARAALEVGVPLDDYELHAQGAAARQTQIETGRGTEARAAGVVEAVDDHSDGESTYSEPSDDFDSVRRQSSDEDEEDERQIEPLTPPTMIRVTTETTRSYFSRDLLSTLGSGPIPAGGKGGDGEASFVRTTIVSGWREEGQGYAGDHRNSLRRTSTATSDLRHDDVASLSRLDTGASLNSNATLPGAFAAVAGPSESRSDVRTLAQIRADLRKSIKINLRPSSSSNQHQQQAPDVGFGSPTRSMVSR
ncbi:hypothetical protein PYCC9005_004904 [Savitreella phatthalungensis]